MAVIRSKHQIPTPATDLLSYLFDAPYKEQQEEAWLQDEPLFLSPPRSSYPSYTFDQIKHLTTCLASGLQCLGGRGRRVMIYGESSVHFQIALLGTLGAGASASLCPLSPVHDVAFNFRHFEPDFVIFNAEELDNVCAAAEQANIARDRLFALDHSTERGETRGQVRHWSHMFDFNPEPAFQWRRLSSEESKETTALYLHTSGSTGSPKMAELTHYGLIGNTEQFLFRYHRIRRGKEIFFSTFKTVGIGGVLMGLLSPLKARYKSIFVGRCDLEAYLNIMETFRPTYLCTPKYIIQQLLDLAPQADFSSATEVITGAAMVPFKMRDAWFRLHGSPCHVSYGLTEVGLQIIVDPLKPVRGDDVGELLANVEAKVVDASGQAVERNQTGELWICSPYRMKQYLNEPGQTAELFTDDGWLRTGDICRVNDEDEWSVLGRIKDLFKVEGNHVSASEIESSLLLHPSIVDASVVPVVLPQDAEPIPRAYLIRKPGSELTLEEFFRWMISTLGSEMQLQGGAGFLQSLPIANGGNGKPDRRALKERAARDVALFPESIPHIEISFKEE